MKKKIEKKQLITVPEKIGFCLRALFFREIRRIPNVLLVQLRLHFLYRRV